MEKGKLYLIPVPLGEGVNFTLPEYLVRQLHRLDVFIVERAKTARRFIKSTGPLRPISHLRIFELDKHDPGSGIRDFLVPALEGQDIGLLSEAGCPGVADPGALVVRSAHQLGLEVVPLVGPSSIVLALMASGLNGQNFCFRGYLPPKKPELTSKLKWLEQQALHHEQTQIFIETPYRNQALITEALRALSPRTRFSIAANLTLPDQFISTRTVKQWQQNPPPNLHKKPAIFLIGA